VCFDTVGALGTVNVSACGCVLTRQVYSVLHEPSGQQYVLLYTGRAWEEEGCDCVKWRYLVAGRHARVCVCVCVRVLTQWLITRGDAEGSATGRGGRVVGWVSGDTMDAS
jgi:hypothetical protein